MPGTELTLKEINVMSSRLRLQIDLMSHSTQVECLSIYIYIYIRVCTYAYFLPNISFLFEVIF